MPLRSASASAAGLGDLSSGSTMPTRRSDIGRQRLPSQLSGGQKQRANLARALAAEPDLLVCDEVTAALDSIVSSRILALLSTLRRQLGTACIFITQDVSIASKLADQIYVMHQGQVVEAGQSPEVVARPQRVYPLIERSSWHAQPPHPGMRPSHWDYQDIVIHHAGRSYSCGAPSIEEIQRVQAEDMGRGAECKFFGTFSSRP